MVVGEAVRWWAMEWAQGMRQCVEDEGSVVGVDGGGKVSLWFGAMATVADPTTMSKMGEDDEVRA